MGTVDTAADLEGLIERFHVQATVIDALPEQRLVADFCRGPRRAWAAWYTRSEPGVERVRGENGNPDGLHLHRVEALDRMLQRVREGIAEIPRDARHLGGRIRDGVGEYYRELRAPQRTLVQTADGNWEAKWVHHGRPDHYAHAEVYCLYAEEVARRTRLILTPVPERSRSPLYGIQDMKF